MTGIYGADAMRRYLQPYLALAPHDVWAEGARLVQRLLDSARGRADPTALLQGVPDQGLFIASIALARLPDSAELSVSLARFIGSRSRSGPLLSDSNFVKRDMAGALMRRGHLRAGLELLSGLESYASFAFADAALLGAVPAERAAAVFRERLSGPASQLLVGAFPWWVSQRDTSSLRLAETRADSPARRDPDPNSRALARYAAASAAAYLALARKDTSAALERFLALPDGGCPACYLDRLTLAHLLVERRRDREAWRILHAEHPASTLVPFATEVLWTLLRGRVAERLGERDRAAQSYA